MRLQNSSKCNAGRHTGIRAAPATASSQDSASKHSHLKKTKKAGESVMEVPALWDVFTEVWATAGLY